MALFNEFKGIQQYHDGMAVSDYRNLFPMGTTVLDRLGEHVLDSKDGLYRGKFVDSLGNIYVVVDNYVNVYTYVSGVLASKGRVTVRSGNDLVLLNTIARCTFCESSTKPSQVYMCDGKYVYWWNTTAQADSLVQTAMQADVLINPGVLPVYMKQLVTESYVMTLQQTVFDLQNKMYDLKKSRDEQKAIWDSEQRALDLSTTGKYANRTGDKFANSLTVEQCAEALNGYIMSGLKAQGYSPKSERLFYADQSVIATGDMFFGGTHTTVYYKYGGQPVSSIPIGDLFQYLVDAENLLKTEVFKFDDSVEDGYCDILPGLQNIGIGIDVYMPWVEVYNPGYTAESVAESEKNLKTARDLYNTYAGQYDILAAQLATAKETLSKNKSAYDNGDRLTAIQSNIDVYAYVSGQDHTRYDNLGVGYDFSHMANVDSVLWFNNRLVSVQGEKNTVWISATDPGQFFRTSGDMITDDSGLTYYTLPNAMFTSNDSDTTDAENTVTAQNMLWTFWVSSSNGADRLRQVVGFGGNLYFLNQNTIEPWSATNIEDNPIQNTAQNIIHFGGRGAVVFDNELYIVANDQMNNVFIAKISGSQLSRVSNPEIERRLPKSITGLSLITNRADTFVLVHNDKYFSQKYWPYSGEAYAVTQQSYWFRWENPVSEEYAVESIIDDIAVSNRGSVIQFLPDKRTLDSGFPITRSIRDWFLTFTGRKIVRSVEVLMDAGKKIGTLLNPATTKGSTGKAYTPDDREQDQMWCSVSFDRANSFGPRRMRNLGRSDNNAFVVIWRNLGSGNNFAIEFGTSANYRFQIYQVDIQVQ